MEVAEANAMPSLVSKLALLGIESDDLKLESFHPSELLSLIDMVVDEALLLVQANEQLQQRELEISRDLEEVSSQLRQSTRAVAIYHHDSKFMAENKERDGSSLDDTIVPESRDTCCGKLMETIRVLNAQIKDYAEHEQVLSSSVAELKQSKDDLAERLQVKTKELEERNNQLHTEGLQRTELSDQIATLEKDRNELRLFVGTIDAERDRIDNEFDEAKIELKGKHLREQKLQKDLSRIKIENSSLRKSVGELQKALTSRDKMTLELRHKLQETEENYIDVKRILSIKNNELGRSQHDVAAITRESQLLSNESSRLMSELQSAKVELKNASQKNASLDQAKRIMEVEKADLVKTYRAVVEERFAFEQINENLRKKIDIISHHLDKCQEGNRHMEQKMLEMEQEIRKRALNASKFERQLDNISRQNLSIQRKLEATEAENSRLRKDVEISQESKKQISNHAQELHLSSAKARDEYSSLQTMLEITKQERDALHKLFSDEKQKCHGLEILISAARAKDAAASDQLKRLAKENAMLTTKVNEVTTRLAKSNVVSTKAFNVTESDQMIQMTNLHKQITTSPTQSMKVIDCMIHTDELSASSRTPVQSSNVCSDTNFDPQEREISTLDDYLNSPDCILSKKQDSQPHYVENLLR